MELAQIVNPILGETPSRFNFPVGFLQAFLPKLVTIVLMAGAVIFLFVMLFAGISWMASGGDKQGIENARSRLTNGLIGFVIILSVFAIARLLELLFGIDILALDIDKLIVE